MSDADRQNWISLTVAASQLGVSESTVRRWADSGEVQSYRTPGGHRRILEDDLRRLVSAAHASPGRDTDRISDIALARVKRRISHGRQGHSMAGLDSLGDDVKGRLRLLGRQLVDLFARYIASDSKKDRFSEDARTIGREYGRTLVAERVGLTTAIATFNSMRRSLEETASQIATEAGLPADEAVDAVEDSLVLADIVLEGMAEVYEGAMDQGGPR